MKETDKKTWESFITNNKSQFESKEPEDLWDKIEEELPLEKESAKLIDFKYLYKYAAIFIIAFGLGSLVMYFNVTNSSVVADQVVTPEREHEVEQPEYVIELAEVEGYYNSEIDNKLKELKEFEDSEAIIEELNLLQIEFDALKSEMGDQINDERIVRAMIQNYRLRLELLKEILEEIHPDVSNSRTRNYGNKI